MKCKLFIYNPVQFNERKVNEDIKDAYHIETYLKDEGRFGGNQTLCIFAFFKPDKKEKEVSCKTCRLLYKNEPPCEECSLLKTVIDNFKGDR